MTRFRFLTVTLLFVAFTSTLNAQNEERKEAYAAFDVFLGGSWEIDAFFLDGKRLMQKFEITKGANGQIFHSKTWQKNDAGEYQLHSEGVRSWDEMSRSFKFWEWGVDGSSVSGSIVIEGKNILYIYEYGDEIVTDVYSYERDGLFEYIIGVKEGDKWANVYANGGVTKQP